MKHRFFWRSINEYGDAGYAYCEQLNKGVTGHATKLDAEVRFKEVQDRNDYFFERMRFYLREEYWV